VGPKGKLRSEGLTYLPPSLALRKEAHDALEAVVQARRSREAAPLSRFLTLVSRETMARLNNARLSAAPPRATGSVPLPGLAAV
jgi:hypothetical protein